MTKNEMQFMIVATFIWSKHDGVWCFIVKLRSKEIKGRKVKSLIRQMGLEKSHLPFSDQLFLPQTKAI